VRFQPAHSRGAVVGIGLLLAMLAISVGLTWAAYLSGPSPRAVLLALPLAILLPALILVAYWTWGLLTLAYEVGRDGLVVRWAGRKQVIPMAEITHVVKSPPDAVARGVRWPGYAVGHATVNDPELGEREALVFATVPPADRLLVVTRSLAYAISPENPAAFADEFKRRRELGVQQVLEERTESPPWERWSILSDRTALVLLALTGLLNALAFAWLAWHHPELPSELALRYRFDPLLRRPVPDQTAPASVAWRLPLVGLGTLGFNTLVAGWAHRHSRLAARLLLGGALLVQLALAVALLRAVR
jgi:hypothetical protein